MAEPNSFDAWITGLRAGDESAANEVFQRFTRRVVALARSRLDDWMRRKEDPEDIAQSVYQSFFVRIGNGQWDVATWNDLWSLLAIITIRKCANRAKHFQADRRAIANEFPLQPGDDSSAPWVGLDREPTPLEAAILADTVHQVLGGLAADDRAIIELSLQGYTTEEIHQQLGFSQRTVRRVREHLKKRLRKMETD